MGNYVIIVPGTIQRPMDPSARRALLAVVHGADPEEVGGQVPDLDVLTLDEPDGTFVLRLEVQAADRTAAGRGLRRRATGSGAGATGFFSMPWALM
ncbi:hypothetical protein [Streptomyces sp. NRRL B-24484]|uniref:hypothetical protein n=1 Tax=Streptomyces sp. NRRL B-24484 TaxID=1463833 RepID=UPI000694DC61|nr:hypothetical protein [Streptomyces sp. NRRL B-24484]